MKILIIKHGALGDVVRTSYFPAAIKSKYGENIKISWITHPSAKSLLINNPFINDIFIDFNEIKNLFFDHVYSLDDEYNIVKLAMTLSYVRLTGAMLSDSNILTYTSDSSEWFDMGLLSNYGKSNADKLKVLNKKGHSEIFKNIFDVKEVRPLFYGDSFKESCIKEMLKSQGLNIGINPYSGGRWKAKEMRRNELISICREILSDNSAFGKIGNLILLGAGDDKYRNLEIKHELNHQNILIPNTDQSLLEFAAYIKALDYLITSDSLALHLAISQNIPCLAFFSPTSAAEIDDFGICIKLKSTSNDYCSYKPDADNSTITAERILMLLNSRK